MPTVFRADGLRFFFYSNEGNPREPVHVHVEGEDGEAKLWLRTHIEVAGSTGFSRRRLAAIVSLAERRRQEIERAWDEHFG